MIAERGRIHIVDIDLLMESSCEGYGAVRRSYGRIERVAALRGQGITWMYICRMAGPAGSRLPDVEHKLMERDDRQHD